MTIETKFDLNQSVFIIQRYGSNEFLSCEKCKGVGIKVIDGCGFTCNKCIGLGGQYEWVAESWNIINEFSSKIGKISVELYTKKYTSEKSRTTYMVEFSGVGSGTFHYEENVFATKEDALSECDNRNKLNQTK